MCRHVARSTRLQIADRGIGGGIDWCRRGPRFAARFTKLDRVQTALDLEKRINSAVMAMTVNGVGATIQDGGKFLGPNIGNSAYICAVPGRATSGR